MSPRLSRATLSDQVVSALLEHMQSDGLQPGDVLPSEGRLAEEYGVSRPVIREAIRTLAGQGILETVVGKGAVVRPIDSGVLGNFFMRAIDLDEDAMMELFEVRRGLELQSAILAAERRTADDIAALKGLLSSLRSKLDDYESYAEGEVALHLQLAKASKNKMLFHLMESLSPVLKQNIAQGFRQRRTAKERARVQALHENVIAEVEHGNPSAAAQAMTVHFDEAIVAIRAAQATEETHKSPPRGE